MSQAGDELGGRYIIIGKIGQGGSGQVYLARDIQLGKLRAVKTVSKEFKNERELLKKLEHPMIPQMMDYVEDEQQGYLVMEYIQGENLKKLLKERGPFSRAQVLDWGKQICGVMEFLHSQKPPVIYGDLKPENLMLSSQGKLYLVDLGSSVKGYLTQQRVCFGTKGYAAPEQYWGEAVTASDIYSFGKTMAELLGGADKGGRYLEKVLKKCCEKDKEDRWESFALLKKRLDWQGTGVVKRLALAGSAAAVLWAAAASFYAGHPAKTGEKAVEIPVTVTRTVIVTKIVSPSPVPIIKGPTVSITEEPPVDLRKQTPSEKEYAKEMFLEELTRIQPVLTQGFLQAHSQEGKELLKEAEAALKDMEEVYETREEWCRIRFLRIQTVDALEQWIYEKSLTEELLERYPRCREVYGWYGDFLYRTGEKDKSLRLWEDGRKTFGSLNLYGEQRWKEVLKENEELVR